MNIRQQTFSGIRWSFLSKGISAVGSLIQLYILVRYIDPDDFGLMAMVNVSVFFTMNFLDFGINSAIIHKEKITSSQLSTLYWFSILVGSVLTFLLFFSSYLIASFYNDLRLVALIKTLSLILVIGSIGNIFKVLLTKELFFNSIARIEIISFLGGFFITIFFALQGEGVWALIYGTITKTIIENVMAVFLGRQLFLPKRIFDFKEIGFFIRFGLFQQGERLINFFNQQFDVIIIGKLLGPELLGFYDVIKRFLLRPFALINPMITGVLFPVMSKVQNDDNLVKTIYLRQLNYICSINFPIYILMLLNAEAIIELMFGKAWLTYAWVFKVYILVVMSYCTGNPVGTLLLAKGKADWGFYWNLVIVFIMIPSIFFGTFWMLSGVVIGLLLMQGLLIGPNYYFLVKPLIATKLGEYFSNMLFPLFLSILAVGTSTLIIQPMIESLILQLTLITSLTGLLYLILSWKFNSSFIIDLKELLQNES